MNHLHLAHHYHIPRLKEMGRIYWCHSFSALAFSLAGIFVPIYLLKSGISFQGVLAFTALEFILAVILQYPAGKLLSIMRPHALMVLSTVFKATFFLLLGTVELSVASLILLAALWSIDRAVYWSAFHYVFGMARAHQKSGRQIAGLSALILVAATLAPAVGGIVATVFGIQYTYFATVILSCVAILPLMDNKHKGPHKATLSISLTDLRKYWRDCVANLCNGIIVVVENCIWPIFIFLVVSSYAGIGLLSTVIAMASIIITLYVGKREEVDGEKHYINQGIATYSLTSLGRTLAENAGHIFGLNLLAGIGRSLYVTPFLSRYYTNSDGSSRIAYITLMEASHSIGAALFILFLFGLAYVFTIKVVLIIGMLTAALTALGVKLIR